MAWNYSGDPSTSTKDAIRFEIGDTDQSWKLLEDEEIEYALKVEPNWIAAAARCCESIARRFAREADQRLGPSYVYKRQRSEAYKELAQELRRRSSSGMYVGGVRQGEDLLDGHLRQPSFKRGMMGNKGAGPSG